jgi:hypothetical protein
MWWCTSRRILNQFSKLLNLQRQRQQDHHQDR